MASDALRTEIATGIAALVRAATISVAPWAYGRDLKCVDDLTPTLEETDPLTYESLAQDLFHRLTTTRGSIVDDPNFGDDVNEMLSAALTPEDLVLFAGRIVGECRKDDRVRSVSVDVQGDTSRLDITLAVTPEDSRLQDFEMVIGVTSAGAVLEAIR